MNDDISGWNDWSEAFDNWTDISISELHGIISAIMTVCDAPDSDTWAKLFSELSLSPLSSVALGIVTEEAEDVSFQLKDKDEAYAFMPLVVDDEHELYERVIGIKDWTSGYITGMGIADCELTTDELQTISDLTKIASIRINSEDEFEGGEESYLHLFEFVRMVPVSLATRKRKAVTSLRLLAGLSVGDKTANEIALNNTHSNENVEVNDIDDVICDSQDLEQSYQMEDTYIDK